MGKNETIEEVVDGIFLKTIFVESGEICDFIRYNEQGTETGIITVERHPNRYTTYWDSDIPVSKFIELANELDISDKCKVSTKGLVFSAEVVSCENKQDSLKQPKETPLNMGYIRKFRNPDSHFNFLCIFEGNYCIIWDKEDSYISEEGNGIGLSTSKRRIDMIKWLYKRTRSKELHPAVVAKVEKLIERYAA